MKRYVIGSIILVIVVYGLLIGLSGRHRTNVPSTATNGSYVAMGDSVAAGVGLLHDSDSSACNRTNQAYPNLVAHTLNYKLKNLACSGATLPAGILGQQDVNDLLETPQIQQLFAQPKPNLITLTIGANDANWTGILAKCYSSECGTAADTAAVQTSLVTVTKNLNIALTDIKNHYGTTAPRVIVTGYYQVFPAANVASCSDLTGIDAPELAWGRMLQSNISTSLQTAAKNYSFATYVSLSFSGHELCTSDPWVQGLSDNQPYHPTAAGQTAIANQINSAIKATN